MAKKSQRKRKKSANKTADKSNGDADLGGPWLSMRTGLIVMIVLSVVLTAYITWQLLPTEGSSAILWGLGFSASLWVIAGFFYLFNTFVRGRR